MLVIDRINGVAYVALSERADRGLAEVWGPPRLWALDARGFPLLLWRRSRRASWVCSGPCHSALWGPRSM